MYINYTCNHLLRFPFCGTASQQPQKLRLTRLLRPDTHSAVPTSRQTPPPFSKTSWVQNIYHIRKKSIYFLLKLFLYIKYL